MTSSSSIFRASVMVLGFWFSDFILGVMFHFYLPAVLVLLHTFLIALLVSPVSHQSSLPRVFQLVSFPLSLSLCRLFPSHQSCFVSRVSRVSRLFPGLVSLSGFICFCCLSPRVTPVCFLCFGLHSVQFSLWITPVLLLTFITCLLFWILWTTALAAIKTVYCVWVPFDHV